MDTPQADDPFVNDILTSAAALTRRCAGGMAGVTAGYDPDPDIWYVEVHQPGAAIDIIPVTAEAPDQETAQDLAKQIAAERGLPYIEVNTGLIPARHLVDKIRAAAWMQGEDDPALLAEIARLRRVEEDAISRGWNRVTSEPPIVEDKPGATTYFAARTAVTATSGGTVHMVTATDPEPFTPDEARSVGAALIAAAKLAEDLKQFADATAAGHTVIIPGTGADDGS